MHKTLFYQNTLTPDQYSFDHTHILYDQSLRATYNSLAQARIDGQDREAVALASNLIELAKLYDIQKTHNLIQKPYLGNIDRDLTQPSSFTHPSLIGQIWADDAHHPLEAGEEWNNGKRITNTSVSYAINSEGLPVNPYVNFGINGRGVIGRYGPNHAVDNGLLRIMPNAEGKPALHALGIIRKDDGRAALCGGFTEFKRNANGHYDYTQQTMVDTQAMEFIEELVSGSVDLLPDYAHYLDYEIAQALAKRTAIQGKPLSAQQTETITNQIVTHRKMDQITHEDPQFVRNVKDAFSESQLCYAGPVLNSARNTNQAWMETRLSWMLLDEDKWNSLKAGSPFDYDFKAGDDAQNVLWHEITPDLIKGATGSHDAFFSYLLSSYLLTQKHSDQDILKVVKDQARDLITYYQDAPVVDHPTCTF